VNYKGFSGRLPHCSALKSIIGWIRVVISQDEKMLSLIQKVPERNIKKMKNLFRILNVMV